MATIMTSLPNKKSAGYDGIPMGIVKNCYSELTEPLLFPAVLLEAGEFPDSAKLAMIKSLFKKSNLRSPENYCPISLLTTFSKSLERVVCD